jgi:hypothetical protein
MRFATSRGAHYGLLEERVPDDSGEVKFFPRGNLLCGARKKAAGSTLTTSPNDQSEPGGCC